MVIPATHAHLPRSTMIVVRALALLLLVSSLTAQAQSPTLDPEYGQDGFARGLAASPLFNLESVRFVTRPDGSVYYTTITWESAISKSRVGLQDADGEGVLTFGTDGAYGLPALAGTPTTPSSETASDIIEDSRGHAVIVGTSTAPVGDVVPAPFMLRLRPDGTPDPRFPYRRIEMGVPAYASKVIQVGGRYLVGISTATGCGLLAVGPTGEIQSDYGVDGYAVLPVGSSCSTTALDLDASGRVLVGLNALLDGERRAVVVRVSRTGRIDQRYGTDGMYLPVPDLPTVLKSLVVAEDGRIHTAGYTIGDQPDKADRGFVTRGAMNGRAGTEGSLWRWFSEPLGSLSFTSDGGLAVSADGSSYVSTRVLNEATGYRDLTIARLDRFGRLDASFGTGGVYTEPSILTPGGSPERVFYSNTFLDLTPAGRLLVGGMYRTTFSYDNSVYLIGYQVDGTPQTSALARSEATVTSSAAIRVGPNPTRGEVRIRVQTGESVTARVFDALGRLVATPADGTLAEEVVWTSPAGASGVYVVVIDSGEFHEVVPVTVAR